MDTYTLTADDADKVNAASGVASNGDGTYNGAYAVEGQSYPAVKLPTGTTLVFVDSDVPLRVPGDAPTVDESGDTPVVPETA